jgi:hypothetical protein
MRRSRPKSAACLVQTPLAVCLALALASASALAQDRSARNSRQPAAIGATGRPGAQAKPSSTTLEVSSCDDDGSPGTLRAVIGAAGDADTVDMSLLTCSTITLAAGQIDVLQDNLDVRAAPDHPVTIDAGSASRVIEHAGHGVLRLENLEITSGAVKYDTDIAFGGCIASVGSIYLNQSNVTSCHAVSTGGPALGGGLFAEQYIYLFDSAVSGNSVTGVDAEGGGAWSYGLTTTRSSISYNSAVSTIDDPSQSLAEGGGFLAKGTVTAYQLTLDGNQASSTYGLAIGGGGLVRSSAMLLTSSTVSGNSATSPGSNGGGMALSGTDAPHYILYSTFDHNESVNNSALAFYGTASEPNKILSSTISGNTATTGSSAIFASNPLYIYNSTIAFNHSAGSSAGLYLYPGGDAVIDSTIISNNSEGSGGGFDIVAHATVSGSHDLIQNPGSTVPGDTIVGIDPLLGPLADNGGPTRTHALAPTSPAIDFGFNPFGFTFDQRRAPRVFGVAADIGAYEWQGDDTDVIFADGFDP